jgi:hypothetical protein
MQMLELLQYQDNNMHTCPTPMTFLLMSGTSPIPRPNHLT